MYPFRNREGCCLALGCVWNQVPETGNPECTVVGPSIRMLTFGVFSIRSLSVTLILQTLFGRSNSMNSVFGSLHQLVLGHVGTLRAWIQPQGVIRSKSL